jgi:hypothetical protein
MSVKLAAYNSQLIFKDKMMDNVSGNQQSPHSV